MEAEDSPTYARTDSSSTRRTRDKPSISSSTNPTSTEHSSSEPTFNPTSSNTGPGTGSGSAGTGTTPGRRRKVPDTITLNACTVCKKARAKCDGDRPACKRCVSRHIEDECHYELHAKTAKEQMMREIHRLQRKTTDLQSQNDSLEATNEYIEQIMSSLKVNGQGTEIIRRLKRGDSHEAIACWLREPKVGVLQSLSPATERSFSEALERVHSTWGDHPHLLYWTHVEAPTLIEHLIRLYLTWIHPVHMLFDENHFLDSFENCKDVYCSASLVNIICAMACQFLHDTHVDSNEAPTLTTIFSLRRRFVKEAQAKMGGDLDYQKMTNLQTYAIMFLVELSCGRGLLASSHLRLAVENTLIRYKSEQTSQAGDLATWGILTLHTFWSGFTYQKPSAPVSTRGDPIGHLVPQFGNHQWHMYTHVKEEHEENTADRQSHAVQTAAEHTRLFRIVHETILCYCGSRGRVTADALLKLYDRHLEWEQRLPANLKPAEGDCLPHVLFLHIQYQTILVHFLQPLLHLEYRHPHSYAELCACVLRHATTGLRLLYQYRYLYSNNFITPLQLFCIVHICDALVRYTPSSSPSYQDTLDQTLKFCFTTLGEARLSYPLATPLLKMFEQSLRELGVPLPDDLQGVIPAGSRGTSPDELLDACTRPTYRQPSSQILANMEDGLGQKFMDEWERMTRVQATGEGEPMTWEHEMQGGYAGGQAGGHRHSRSGDGKGKGRMDVGSLLND